MTAFTWRYPLREIRRRPVRAALTVVGIMLGVAAATAVMLGARATQAGYPGLFTTLSGRAQLELRGIAQTPFVTDLDRVVRIAGVETVAPLVQAPVAILTDDGPTSLMLLGVDPVRDPPVRAIAAREGLGYQIGEGRPGLWLPSRFANRQHLRIDDTVRIQTSHGTKKVRVAGILADRGPATFDGGALGVLPLDEAQALLDLPGRVHAVSVVVAPNASLSEVRRRLQDAYPNLEVGPPTERGESAVAFLASVDQPLASLGAVAVIAGALVILNTFLMHLGERRRQLALLRALGATREQIAGLLLRQALLLGGIGTVLGVPLGIGLAWQLLRLYESFMTIPLTHLPLSWSLLAFAAALGPLMTWAATLLPIHRAARREPLPELLARAGDPADGPRRKLSVVGFVLVGAVLLFVLAIVKHWLPGAVGTRLLPVVVSAAMIGCACLVPLVQTPLLRFVGLLIGPLFGVEGRLAVRHLIRHRDRTGLTVGVLFAAMTAAISFGVSLFNNTRDIHVWFDHTIDAPFFVRAVMPDPALAVRTASLPSGTAEAIARLNGVGEVNRIRFVALRGDDFTMMLIARDLPAGRVPLLLHSGDADALPGQFRAGEVVLGTALAQRLGVGTGDTITLPTPHGPQAFRVAALVKEYSIAGMAGYMDYELARRHFDFDSPHALAVSAAPGQTAALASELEHLAAREGVWVQPQEQFRGVIQKTITGVYWLIVGMLVLIIGVAAAGIVNTLTTNILDQTRELGVLRALGMKRGGVVKLVLAQALALALVACLTGGPAGVLVAWLMNVSTPGLLGHHVPFYLHPAYVGACLAGVIVLSLLAALVPARRAAHLAVIDAVRYE